MIEFILDRIKMAIQNATNDVDVKIAVDEFDILSKINDAAGSDIAILDVGNEDILGDVPEIGVCATTFDVYVARSFGLAEITDSDFFKRQDTGKPLWVLRNEIRDAIRNIVIPNELNIFETNYLLYYGAKRFDTPYNLRAAAFVLTFKITGKLPELNSQQ